MRLGTGGRQAVIAGLTGTDELDQAGLLERPEIPFGGRGGHAELPLEITTPELLVGHQAIEEASRGILVPQRGSTFRRPLDHFFAWHNAYRATQAVAVPLILC